MAVSGVACSAGGTVGFYPFRHPLPYVYAGFCQFNKQGTNMAGLFQGKIENLG
jgi:hypothetical protein